MLRSTMNNRTINIMGGGAKEGAEYALKGEVVLNNYGDEFLLTGIVRMETVFPNGTHPHGMLLLNNGLAFVDLLGETLNCEQDADMGKTLFKQVKAQDNFSRSLLRVLTVDVCDKLIEECGTVLG